MDAVITREGKNRYIVRYDGYVFQFCWNKQQGKYQLDNEYKPSKLGVLIQENYTRRSKEALKLLLASEVAIRRDDATKEEAGRPKSPTQPGPDSVGEGTA